MRLGHNVPQMRYRLGCIHVSQINFASALSANFIAKQPIISAACNAVVVSLRNAQHNFVNDAGSHHCTSAMHIFAHLVLQHRPSSGLRSGGIGESHTQQNPKWLINGAFS
jgi:hypothetical protein